CRQVRDVALDIHLGLFPFCGRWQGYQPEDTRAGALGDPLDDTALAGSITAFEEHADLGAGCLYPLLHLDELNLEVDQFLLEFLAAHLRFRFRRCTGSRTVRHSGNSALDFVLLLTL